MFFFFFNDTATTEIYTLSLHDALPISLHSIPSARCSTIWATVHFPAGARCQSVSGRPARGPSTISGRSWNALTRPGTAGGPDRRPRGIDRGDRTPGGDRAATRSDTAPTR